MTQPSLRGRVVVKFPAEVVAGNGMTITKTNQTYTFGLTNLVSYVDDAAAAAGGVPVGGMYHTAGAVKVRVA